MKDRKVEMGLELKILLEKLDDYARILNSGFTPDRKAIAQAQAIKKQIKSKLEEAEGVLSAETIREIRRGVELIVEGSTRALLILSNLYKRLQQ
ncbi:hypothetical protein HYU22_05440 [Candidatus Woesearchaeota archaeon]|nr:hypothetical protein [Candidatus Woesearchaeota archaeon]